MSGSAIFTAIPSAEDLGKVKVLVVGDVMLDRYWFGAVDRISPEAPVPIVRVEREEDRLGGAGNVAVNAAALGAQVCLLGMIGPDEAGLKIGSLLDRPGLRACLEVDDRAKTIVKLRVIGHAQQLLRIDHEYAPGAEVLASINKAFVAELGRCDVVIFSDYGKGALSHVSSMIEVARSVGKPVFVDPKGEDYSRYTGATVITPNRSELERVIGKCSDELTLERRANSLRKSLGLDALLCTRSEDGMTMYNKYGTHNFKAEAKEVFDVTGAGDTVIAVMSVLIGAGLYIEDAVHHANRAAGMVVGRFGTASVTRDDLAE